MFYAWDFSFSKETLVPDKRAVIHHCLFGKVILVLLPELHGVTLFVVSTLSVLRQFRAVIDIIGDQRFLRRGCDIHSIGDSTEMIRSTHETLFVNRCDFAALDVSGHGPQPRPFFTLYIRVKIPISADLGN
jgi:hypothetical protein